MSPRGVCELCGYNDDSYRIEENGTVMRVCKLCHDGHLERMGLSPDEPDVGDLAMTLDIRHNGDEDLSGEELLRLKMEQAERERETSKVPTLDPELLGTLLNPSEDDKKILNKVRQREQRRKKKAAQAGDDDSGEDYTASEELLRSGEELLRVVSELETGADGDESFDEERAAPLIAKIVAPKTDESVTESKPQEQTDESVAESKPQEQTDESVAESEPQEQTDESTESEPQEQTDESVAESKPQEQIAAAEVTEEQKAEVAAREMTDNAHDQEESEMKKKKQQVQTIETPAEATASIPEPAPAPEPIPEPASAEVNAPAYNVVAQAQAEAHVPVQVQAEANVPAQVQAEAKPEPVNVKAERERQIRERVLAAANQTIDDERIQITSPEIRLSRDERPKTNLDVAISEYTGEVRFLDAFKYVINKISYSVFLALIVLAVSTVLFINEGWQHGLIALGGGAGAILLGLFLSWYLSYCYEKDRRALLLRIRQQEILFKSVNSDCYRELRTKFTVIKGFGKLLNRLTVLLPLAVMLGGNILAVILAFLKVFWLMPVISAGATVAAVLVYYVIKFIADWINYALDRERNQQLQQQTLLDILSELKKK